MINSTEEMRKICATFIIENFQEERPHVIEKLEDCLDFVAAIQAINEVSETGDVSDWDEFEKELDALE